MHILRTCLFTLTLILSVYTINVSAQSLSEQEQTDLTAMIIEWHNQGLPFDEARFIAETEYNKDRNTYDAIYEIIASVYHVRS